MKCWFVSQKYKSSNGAELSL